MKRILPAYPLFVKDPYFSLWMPSEDITGTNAMFWNSSTKRMFGLITVGDKKYRFLGDIHEAQKLRATDVRLTAFGTEFDFACSDFNMTARFLSPLPPDDLDMLSCPVCYLEYNIYPKKPISDKVSVLLTLSDEHCCDNKSRNTVPCSGIVGGVIERSKDCSAAWFGLRRQAPLSVAGDSCSADWGYFYVEGKEAYYHTWDDYLGAVIDGNTKAYIAKEGDKFITAVDRHKAGQKEYKGCFRVAFDDVVAINYFGDFLKGYFLRDGKNILDALEFAKNNFELAKKKDNDYTDKIIKDSAVYGDGYKTLLFASLRQSVGAHKLVEDKQGRVLFLSKECHSNGCIATVDVSYPSIPLYLLYNPELVRGMLEPILDFAKMPVWEYDFAPHDTGTYPQSCGQAYGMNGCEAIGADVFPHGKAQGVFYPIYQYPKAHKLYKHEDQMPVEECANMLIMTALYFKYSDKEDIKFLEYNYELLAKWVEYLYKFGKVPEHQLCTDDFAGRMAKNVNLSIKASAGIAAFGIIAKALGKTNDALKAEKSAKDHTDFVVDKFKNNNTTPLAFDLDSKIKTYSIKYNLAADLLLGSKLYPQIFLDREINNYKKLQNKYGMPLDNRKGYTKSDWILWAAALARDKKDAAELIAPVEKYLRETPSRVPFSDWYDTLDAKQCGFQNRTVQGGIFILLLKDKLQQK